MPSFLVGPNLRTPFGRNHFLRSTKDIGTIGYTVSAASVPSVTIDTYTQKVLQPGVVLAKITSGGESGKVGPYKGLTGAADEQQTVTIDATGGTFTITYAGETTTALAWNATAAVVKTALELLGNINPGDVSVSLTGLVYTITFKGQYHNQNVPQVTTAAGSLTGGAGTATAATTVAGTPGTGGATDGRGDPLNIVGINNTFLPWQLMDRDVEVAVLYDAVVVQANCFELNSSDAFVALTDDTAAQMVAKKSLDITFF